MMFDVHDYQFWQFVAFGKWDWYSWSSYALSNIGQ